MTLLLIKLTKASKNSIGLVLALRPEHKIQFLFLDKMA